MSDIPQNPKHRARALQAIAHERCVTDLTDGFCGPRDGKCSRQNPGMRRCDAQAESILRAIETVGCYVVWHFDKRPTEPPLKRESLV